MTSHASRDGAPAARQVIARAENTLAAASARIELRVDTRIVGPERQQRRSPGPAGKLARTTVRAAWARIAPGVDATRLRDAFLHQGAEGFIEPAAGRYLIDYGGYAEMCIDGRHFGGGSGQPLQARHRIHRPPELAQDPLGLLRLLLGTADAQRGDDEMLRGTPCRTIIARAGGAELTAWIDAQHVRRIRVEDRAEYGRSSASKTLTVELWDFGVAVDSLDWSRLPSIRPLAL